MIHPDLVSLAFPIARLDSLEGNPHDGDVAAVARSYERFGQRKPITAKGRRPGKRGRAMVTAGNTQLAAARELGWTEIAVVFVDDTDEEAKAWALADNRTAELGTTSTDRLLAMWADLEDEVLRAATGWTDEALVELQRANRPPGGRPDADPDAVPDRGPTVSKRGDVWLLGEHRLMCGSSRVAGDVERLMAGCKADAVWTDPPYGVSYVGKTADALTISGDGADEYVEVLRDALDRMLDVVAPGAPVYVSAPAGPAGVPFAVLLAERGLFRQRLVWVKDSLVLGRSDYHYRHEDVYLGHGPGHRSDRDLVYLPEHDDVVYGFTPGGKGRRGRGGVGWWGGNAQTSVLQFPRPKASREHPTMKPVDLIAHCLNNSTAPDQVVLDMFTGSGSTLIACERDHRRFVGMELAPAYVDIACRRWQEFTGERPVLERTGRPRDFTKGRG